MHEPNEREVRIIRLLVRTAGVVLVIALLIYPADWALWRLRVAFGGGMDSVQVTQFTVAELKGNKEDYYPDGTAQMPCSRSLFGQGGHPSCWKLRKNATVIERF